MARPGRKNELRSFFCFDVRLGFWSTAFVALVPPWALYLVAEKLMQLTSFI
jgi:hypothetical protein